MKLVSSIAVVVGLFLTSTSAQVNKDKRNATLEHFKNNTGFIRSRGARMDKNGTRFDCTTVTGGGSKVCQLTEVEGTAGGGRRRLEASRLQRLSGTVLPYPSNGLELAYTDRAILFQENTTLADITCFYFDENNDGVDIISTCSDITQDADVGVASVQMQGLEAGSWTWWAENVNGETTSPQTFTLLPAASTRDADGNIIMEANWASEGQVQGATGRIYYSSNGVDYACSGTVIQDNRSGRSTILTAAHCVWDDIDEQFGTNAIFVPNRDSVDTDLTGDQIHRQCLDDICGCWTLSAGFVHDLWRDEPWPERLAYDWGLWVVDDVGAHDGNLCGSEALDEAVEPMKFDVAKTTDLGKGDNFVTGLGYPLEHNPQFQYCADTVGYNQPTMDVDTYWMPACGLSGGASGGPWIMDLDSASGIGSIVSVNSWSYSDNEGMGGPIIDESEARCLVNAALNSDFEAIEAREAGEEGEFVSCYDRDCVRAGGAVAASGRRLRGHQSNRKCSGTNKRIIHEN